MRRLCRRGGRDPQTPPGDPPSAPDPHAYWFEGGVCTLTSGSLVACGCFVFLQNWSKVRPPNARRLPAPDLDVSADGRAEQQVGSGSNSRWCGPRPSSWTPPPRLSSRHAGPLPVAGSRPRTAELNKQTPRQSSATGPRVAAPCSPRVCRAGLPLGCQVIVPRKMDSGGAVGMN